MPKTGTPQRTIHEQAREVPVVADVDVLVVGGGPAGVCAAVAAARAGARTFLVERHGFLGGMWTAGMVLTLAGYNSWLRPYQRCVEGVPAEWLARAAKQDGAVDGDGWVLNSDPEVMKRVADEMLEAEGVGLLLHSWGARPIVEDGAVRGVFVENVDGRRAILAKVTVDCTGNGDIMAGAGADWVKGDTLQPMTMPFRVGNVKPDPDREHAVPVRIPIGPEATLLEEPLLGQVASTRKDIDLDVDAMRAARVRGELPPFGGPWFGGMEKDIAWVNTTRVVGDASDADELTRAELRGRKDSVVLLDYMREHSPAFADGRLLQTSTQIGVRETRRLVGAYTLTGDDVRASARFDDGIAVGCWPIDVHPAEGEVGVHAMFVPLPYEIPYRSLLPQETDSLLVAGRCISVDREALGSARVGATCAATGQAAGVAAALAANSGKQPRELDSKELRSTIQAQGGLVTSPAP
ncbi:FAD-dependent oxidoreductase [Streptomyces sp. NPDC050421]|uniref:FAD-dependent oxidoreductase n=1 Tax=unclassified Streptomyces TaxID=2593676 RepID=UPI0037B14930